MKNNANEIRTIKVGRREYAVAGRFGRILTTGGRTGRKVHRATEGSSTLGCGHWTKSNVLHFYLGADTPEERERVEASGHELCERCFGKPEEREAKQAEFDQKQADLAEWLDSVKAKERS